MCSYHSDDTRRDSNLSRTEIAVWGKIGTKNHPLCLYQSIKGNFSLFRGAKRSENLCIFLGSLRR